MSGELVSDVKILKGYLYANVRLGCTDKDVVTTTVRVATAGADVQEALGPLYELLRERARTLAGQAMNATVLQAERDRAVAEIRAGVASAIEATTVIRVAEIEEAIAVVRDVGRIGHGETWDRSNRRRTSLRKLKDVLDRAVG